MGNAAFEGYDEWDLSPVHIPVRSTLFSLKPIGVGTPWVESLTSYIARLADAHCVFPGVLMEKIIVPLAFGFSPLKGTQALFKGDGDKSNLLNATGIRAQRAVQELEKLTLRKDLHDLTLLTWTEVLYIRGLIRLTRAWCPLCYEEWRISGQLIYDPLLWALLPVTVCVSHHVYLSQFCPYEDCHRQLPGLSWRSMPGYCSYCHRWLGHSQDMMQSPTLSLDDETLAWQEWATQSLGSLLVLAPTVVNVPTKNQAITVLRRCVQQLSGGNAREFGQLIGVSRLMVTHWLREDKIPEIEALLRISYVADVPLGKLVLSSPETLQIRLKDAPIQKPHKKRQQKPLDIEHIRQKLEDVLANNEYPPPSLFEVSRRLGHTLRTLYKCHQTASLEIKNRYKTYLQTQRAERVQRQREEIRQIAVDLRAENIALTRKHIVQHLTTPLSVLDPRTLDAIDEICRELEANDGAKQL
jgi:transcriptional regulator with XRE-family HTH domain